MYRGNVKGKIDMKLVRRIPFQMFILNLFASIVCIAGMVVMRYNLNEITYNYKDNIETGVRDRLDMSDLSRLMSRHYMFVSWHSLSVSPEAMDSCEEEAAKLKEEINAKLDEMSERMTGDEKEQLFHTVYSNAVSYFNNVERALQMTRDGNSETARYYITSYLIDFINQITDDIDSMDGYVAQEMEVARSRMEHSILIARLCEKICMVCICLTLAVCIFLCVNITSRLEKYKNLLEEENERKSQALVEHKNRMLSLQENTIIGMANLIESRDEDTGQHVKRTSRYVELLACAAKQAGYCADILTDEYVELLVKAAPMHDIGKIVVSDVILRKPGRLTVEEFDSIKEHAMAGGRIVTEVMSGIEEQDYVDIAVQIAQGHHEKWDGSGYPRGLKEEEIPICARIMAVADVFDALISKRCYKDAMSVEMAFQIIEESSGTHFDPNLARLFCSIRKEIEAVCRE